MEYDTDIRENVVAELDFEPSVDPAGIGVAVKQGVVTLTGHVSSYEQKLNAEVAARRIKGVRAVAQELTVRLPSDAKTNDDEIANRATQILSWSMPKVAKVTLSVEKGWITLRGEVNWRFQKEEAESAVRKLSGVIGVSNLIKVGPSVRREDIREQITKAFERNAELETSQIEIVVEGNKVTLIGEVRAWYERQMAERAAWAAPGVTQVVDQLSVVS